ncbi:MAG: DinB family protein [Chloroflexi bacterium]|nr:DinB family protein [Chloroflexota bacterium]
MELKPFVQGCFEQHYNSMMRAVDGLSPAEMAWTPNGQCSSIAFLVWHYGRTLDRWLHTRLIGDAQLWESGDWPARLGRAPAVANDTGYAFTPDDLKTYKAPDTAALLEYVAAVRQESIEYFEARSEADFDNITLTNPRGGTISLAVMCQQLLWEFNQHGGQIGYLRGEQRGLEDPGYSGGLLEAQAEKAK